jgi:putative hydrolase of the HAD superfamily
VTATRTSGGRGRGAETGWRLRAVFFDFGGVLATEGFREGLAVIARRAGLDPSRFIEEARDAVYDSGYIVGKGGEHDFWELMRLRTGVAGSDADLSAECLSRFALRPAMMELVREIRDRGLRAVILSDQTDWLERLERRWGFAREFDGVLNSYRIGKGKRDPTLFDDALREFGLSPQEAAFVDDDPANVARAAARGLHAVVFVGEADCRLRLEALLAGRAGSDSGPSS